MQLQRRLHIVEKFFAKNHTNKLPAFRFSNFSFSFAKARHVAPEQQPWD